jgi:hypothetical protein
MQDLPYVDLTGFHTRSHPGKHFISLDPESQEEDDRLKTLLDIDRLTKALGKKVEPLKPGEILVGGELHPVAQTEFGQILAAALQFALGPPGVNGSWAAFVVDPDDYEELKTEVQVKVVENRKNIENAVRRMEQQK